MLSGQYDILVNNQHLAEIIAVILLIIPIFLVFMKQKWIFFYYTISIVANLPLVFFMTFNFSYELILGLAVVIIIVKDSILKRSFRFITTKENLIIILMLLITIGVNLVTSLFNFNKDQFLLRLFVYMVNIFILLIFTYYFKKYNKVNIVKNGFVIGAVILVISMLIELIYGHYTLGLRNLRPAGLLLDPNVCAFTLNLALVISFIKRKNGVFIYDLLMIAARVIIIFGIILTVSRSAYIGTIYILLVLTIIYSKGKRKWIAPTVAIVFIVMYIIFNKVIINFITNISQIIDLNRIFPNKNISPPNNMGGSNNWIPSEDFSNSRIALIKASMKIFSNNFLVGVGIGNVVSNVYLLTGLKMNAHNLYLQLLAESGVFMLFVLLINMYYIYVFIKKIERNNKSIILLILGLIFIESMFNHNLLNINIIYLVIAIIFGLVTLSSKDRVVLSFNKTGFPNRKKLFK